MSRMEIITRTERRRRWSVAERERILAECEAPGATVRAVAQRNDIAESLIYSWRSTRRTAAAVESEPLAFISYGEIASTEAVANCGASPLSASLPKKAASIRQQDVQHEPAPFNRPLPPRAQASYDLVRPHPGNRPGTIDIMLGSGVGLTVDAFVNEKALARVLKALGHSR
jgi:transposase-like protein